MRAPEPGVRVRLDGGVMFHPCPPGRVETVVRGLAGVLPVDRLARAVWSYDPTGEGT